MNLNEIILPDRMKLERRGNDPVVKCEEGKFGFFALRNAAAFLSTKLTESCKAFVSPGLYGYIRKAIEAKQAVDYPKKVVINTEYGTEDVTPQPPRLAIGPCEIIRDNSLTHYSFSIRS